MSKLIEKILWEARVIDYLSDTTPINDSDKIRVYHGFYNAKDALTCLIHGLSGQQQAKRIYSYESGNNPKGLFVSTEFKVVKRNFSGSGVIIEFETFASNLEAPVWAGQDNYFVQGQMTKSFNSDEERTAEQLRKRKEYGEKDPENPRYGKNRISKSDRPDLADAIFNNAEHQALFIGHLNPNEIKTVWFNEGLYIRNMTNEPWTRYDRKTFLKKFGKMLTKQHEGTRDEAQSKMFKPNDNFDLNIVRKQTKEHAWDADDLIDLLKTDTYYQNMFLWPKQIKQLKDMNEENS